MKQRLSEEERLTSVRLCLGGKMGGEKAGVQSRAVGHECRRLGLEIQRQAARGLGSQGTRTGWRRQSHPSAFDLKRQSFVLLLFGLVPIQNLKSLHADIIAFHSQDVEIFRQSVEKTLNFTRRDLVGGNA